MGFEHFEGYLKTEGKMTPVSKYGAWAFWGLGYLPIP